MNLRCIHHRPTQVAAYHCSRIQRMLQPKGKESALDNRHVRALKNVQNLLLSVFLSCTHATNTNSNRKKKAVPKMNPMVEFLLYFYLYIPYVLITCTAHQSIARLCHGRHDTPQHDTPQHDTKRHGPVLMFSMPCLPVIYLVSTCFVGGSFHTMPFPSLFGSFCDNSV